MALLANWRTGDVRRDRRTTLRHCLGMGALRWHRTVETAQSVSLWWDRGGADLDYFTHRRDKGEPRFVCVDRHDLFTLIDSHHLTPQDVIVYLNLLVLRWARRCQTTLTKIGARFQAILREECSTVERNKTRKDRQVLVAEPEPVDDGVKDEFDQVIAAIGASRVKEVTATLRQAQRKRHDAFLPDRLLVVRWARQQMRSRTALDPRDALLRAVSENDYEIEVTVLD